MWSCWIVLTTIAVDPVFSDLAKCHDGFHLSTSDNDICLLFVNEQKNWESARQDCESKNANLVTIVSDAMQTEIDLLVTESIWIGYSLGSDGFFWESGATEEHTNWNDDEPNNANDIEECAESAFQAGWNDLNCEDQRSFVCETTAISVADCTLPDCATGTCGGEEISCSRTCDNGVFGVDAGCPAEDEVKTETCPALACVADCTLPDCATGTCGGEEISCSRTCNNGVFGVDAGCTAEDEVKTETCPALACEEDTDVQKCPNEECWELDTETNNCVIIENSSCFSTSCESSSIIGTLSSKTLNLKENEEETLLIGQRVLYVNDIEEEDCSINVVRNTTTNGLELSFDVPLGLCGTFIEQKENNGISVINFAAVVSYKSDSVSSIINFGRGTTFVNFYCAYDATQTVSVNNQILDDDSIGEGGTDSFDDLDLVHIWDSTFSSRMFDQNDEETTEPISVGNFITIGVDWSITTLSGRAKFMLKKVEVKQGQHSLPILKKNCVLDLISTSILNEEKKYMVDTNYRFKYRTFSMAGNTDEYSDFEIKAYIIVCMVDENGVSHAPECQVATDDSECANDDDPEGFIYSIDT